LSLVLYTAPSAPAGQNAQAAGQRGLPVEVRTQGGLRTQAHGTACFRQDLGFTATEYGRQQRGLLPDY